MTGYIWAWKRTDTLSASVLMRTVCRCVQTVFKTFHSFVTPTVSVPWRNISTTITYDRVPRRHSRTYRKKSRQPDFPVCTFFSFSFTTVFTKFLRSYVDISECVVLLRNSVRYRLELIPHCCFFQRIGIIACFVIWCICITCIMTSFAVCLFILVVNTNTTQ